MRSKVQESYLIKCFIIVFICFVFDSICSYFLPYSFTKNAIVLLPCSGLMIFCLLVHTIEVPERYFFATLCGVFYSVVYNDSLAIYILIYCLIAFIRSYIIKLEKFNLLEAIVFCLSAVCFQETIVYILMLITKNTFYPVFQFIIMRILPTVFLNLFLAIIVYIVFIHIKDYNRDLTTSR